MAEIQLRSFARYAPNRNDRSQRVPIRITDMNWGDAAWWDTRFGVHHVRIKARADRYWPWAGLLPMSHLVQLAKHRFCRPLVIWARTDSGQFVRAGMSIIIENYPSLDVESSEETNFIWYISAADASVLERFGVSAPPALGRVLIDNAIVLAQNAGFSGAMGLHAAQAGGPDLLTVYLKCGLMRLGESAPLPASIRRRNDGRFFYADGTLADALAAKLDAYR